MPLQIHDPIPTYSSAAHLEASLRTTGCQRCDLGFQKNINGCCVARFRGGTVPNKMIIGEAPGKDEDSTRQPFTGPAGRLMDRIWQSVGMDTNDWYLTNVVLCRPVAPKGSGKQNFTPKKDQRDRCRPFLDQQIMMIRPRLIVTVGAVATAAILGKPSITMGDYRGKLLTNLGIKIQDSNNPDQVVIGRPMLFPMLHPAAILHAQRDPAKHLMYKQWMWDDIRRLKQIVEEQL